jgi:hypothetical protein
MIGIVLLRRWFAVNDGDVWEIHLYFKNKIGVLFFGVRWINWNLWHYWLRWESRQPRRIRTYGLLTICSCVWLLWIALWRGWAAEGLISFLNEAGSDPSQEESWKASCVSVESLSCCSYVWCIPNSIKQHYLSWGPSCSRWKINWARQKRL